MSWVRVWIHIVFATKNRYPFLPEEVRPIVFKHMMENAELKKIKVAIINGYSDHAHVLLALNRDMTISTANQLIKGESSNWINKNNLIEEKFMWQDDYWAVSVSESHFQKVCNYIANREEHHRKQNFSDEIEKFGKKYKDKE